MKRLRNTSGLPDELVRRVCDWIAADLGISGFDVECRKSASTLGGKAYWRGSSYHSTARPFVVLRVGSERIKHTYWVTPAEPHRHVVGPARAIGRIYPSARPVRIDKPRFPAMIRPYQYAQHKGRRIWLTDRAEALVYLAAHELRHLFQAKYASPRYHGGRRGRFSEVDTEAYAIHMLRAWRKNEH